MWDFEPPLAHMQFVLRDVLDIPASWNDIPDFEDLDIDTAMHVLSEAGRFAREVLLPLNGPGDAQGCTWDDGRVRVPAGFSKAYQAYCEAGWPSLACAAEWGGQNLPQILNIALYEMLNGVNHAWAMYPGLAHGAYECLKAHAAPELQARYLPKIVSGEWLATMCLTEAEAGSDLGLIHTRAVPVGDISDGCQVNLTGTKIFISGGQHDLSENIVHLVLARLPGAPVGSRGLSLFLAPKVLPDGVLNAIRCDGIEKKMGIKGSATCVLAFDAATAWLVGEPHRGLAAMFVMMNAARLQVGTQGLGHMEMASQNACRYAAQRLQLRALSQPDRSDQAAADPIAWHPAMRRVLLSGQAMVEGMRVLAYWTASLLDESERHPDDSVRQAAAGRASLLTPIVKAFLTCHGHHGANAALQVWGGYGYMHEYGIEQSVRDSRIAMIYEGTNEIQAIDLLLRKVLARDGECPTPELESLLVEIEADALLYQHDEKRAAQVLVLCEHVRACRAATQALATGRGSDPEWLLRVADDYLHALGMLLMGWAWLRSIQAAERYLDQIPDDAWHQDRIHVAWFGMQWLLPEINFRLGRVLIQDAALPAVMHA